MVSFMSGESFKCSLQRAEGVTPTHHHHLHPSSPSQEENKGALRLQVNMSGDLFLQITQIRLGSLEVPPAPATKPYKSICNISENENLLGALLFRDKLSQGETGVTPEDIQDRE